MNNLSMQWPSTRSKSESGPGPFSFAPEAHGPIPRVQTGVEAKAQTEGPLIRSQRLPGGARVRSLDPYQGCEYGCLYCYGREESVGPGDGFARRIGYPADGAARLEAELSRPGYRCRPLLLGAHTDPYQPLEASLEVTRQLLEVLQRYRHPFTLITRSEGVLRDLDLLGTMARQRLCRVEISLCTLEEDLWQRLEPRTPSPGQRLQTLAALHDAGVPTGVRVAPLIPRINDQELEAILSAGRQGGARSGAYQPLHLPPPLRPAFERWLQSHFPGRARYVMSLIPLQAAPARGRGVNPEGLEAQIQQRYKRACQRLGLGSPEAARLDCSRFGTGAAAGQLPLL